MKTSLALAAALALAASASFAQDAYNSTGGGSGAVAAYQWACANPTVVEPILEWGCGALVTLLGLNATLKKLGFTKDSRYVGWLIWALRKVAADVKPPDAVIVKQAAIVVQNSPAARAVGADPTLMTKAADAIQKS